jgi:hypothetical protein
MSNLLMLLLIIACVDLAGVAGILSWRKWGVWILGAVEALALMIKLQTTGLDLSSLVGLGTLVAACFAIATRWKDFE